jgi:hypothetical protein
MVGRSRSLGTSHSLVVVERKRQRVYLAFQSMKDSAELLNPRIILPHFSVSSAMSLPKSAGEPGRTVAPRSAKRALILGSARPELIYLLSLSMIAAGVFLGASMPNHTLTSKLRTVSPTVGKSGSLQPRWSGHSQST